jgi:hypothetical protein
MALRALVVAAALLWPAAVCSQGAFYTGNKLFERCGASRDTADYTGCLGYVAGVVDALHMMENSGVCPPQGSTVGQTVDVVMKYLRDHPEARHHAAAGEVFLALRQAFPCN